MFHSASLNTAKSESCPKADNSRGLREGAGGRVSALREPLAPLINIRGATGLGAYIGAKARFKWRRR